MGQHVNKVSTAVEITHAPTSTTVHCRDSRSQHTNRALALLGLVEKRESQRAKRSYGTKQAMLRDKRHGRARRPAEPPASRRPERDLLV